MTMLRSLSRWAPGLVLLAAIGCSPGGGERTFDAPRILEASHLTFAEMPDYRRYGLRGQSGQAGGDSQRARFVWDTPEGWVAKPATSMRNANFAVAGRSDTECYVTTLRGGGGRVAENINRWRRQMGLPEATAASIEALPKMRLLTMDALRVELDGEFSGMGAAEPRPGYRMLGAFLDIADHAISVKMTGPKAVVVAEAARFEAFCASLRFDPGANQAAATGSEATRSQAPRAATGGLRLRYDTPASWQPGRQGGMRAATFHPDGDGSFECVVFQFKRPSGGDELGNVQRWYGQVGAKLPAEGLEGLPQVTVLGYPSRLVDVRGDYSAMGSAKQAAQGMLAVYAEVPGWVVCVKMTGPVERVQAERARFMAFCDSLALEE